MKVAIGVALVVLAAVRCEAQPTVDCDRQASQRQAAWAQRVHSWLANDLERQASEVALALCRARTTDGREKLNHYEDFGRVLFTGAGIHPVVGTIAPSNGIAMGATLGHEHASATWPLRFSTAFEGRVSWNGSWKIGGFANIVGSAPQSSNRHILATVDVVHGHIKEVRYFTGGNAPSSDASIFAFQETRGGVTIQVPIPGNFSLLGSIHGLTARGHFSDSPPETLPLELSTSYAVYGGGLIWSYPADEALVGYATRMRTLFHQHEEISGAPYSFMRSDFEWSQRYTPESDWNLGEISATVRLTTLHHRNPESVPFYLQPTLGGGDINGVNTLLGYRDYRFRADNTVAAQFEYALPLPIDPLGLAVFYDLGQVTNALESLRLRDVHTSYGLAVRFKAGGNVYFQLSLGRGDEGTRFHFGGNSNEVAETSTLRGVF